jgi:integrase
MSSCRRNGPRKNEQIVSPADDMSLPVHFRDFGTFPRQLCNHSTNCRSAFDEIMAPSRSPTMRHLADQVCVGWAAAHFGRNPDWFRSTKLQRSRRSFYIKCARIVCRVSNSSLTEACYVALFCRNNGLYRIEGKDLSPVVKLKLRRYASQVMPKMETGRCNRYGHRDVTMILLTYRHGLRAAVVCDLRWDQVYFNGAVLHKVFPLLHRESDS